ncbi:TATA box-binding protein-associated factor RNA polymerase I subunit B-like [Limulus polyphemus]|uniref:TATA box-binding protein-associated factor RNA polymerase I subunit B-like n=1 Tax=Limulus polyphemus TaxID=6850 RepID=A0ABM1T4V5_LIMPO|nr:TATA box-binding protein-associated factor RNA polymerase I subunit B-like [Limulus polyphemus]XP_022250911.1 TATA box-binding protein-associated factor RNA polymerase I subunit B-like [Limulus polyphemus]
MPVCEICGAEEFDLHDGLYFCMTCNTQTTQILEEEGEEEPNSQILGLAIKEKRCERTVEEDWGDQWFTLEAYNIIICKQVHALINLGASPKLKDVVFNLWARYIQKCEFAFNKEELNEDTPKIPVYPNHRDLLVLQDEKKIPQTCLFPKVVRQKKPKKRRKKMLKKTENSKKKSKKENLANEDSNMKKNSHGIDGVLEGLTSDQTFIELESRPSSTNKRSLPMNVFSARAQFMIKKHGRRTLWSSSNLRTRSTKVEVMTLIKTVSFCWLGLLLLKDQVLLSDFLRWSREGKIPLYDAYHYLPARMKLQWFDWNSLDLNVLPSIDHIYGITSKLAFFLELYKLPPYPIMPLVSRFVMDLNLPAELVDIVQKLAEKTGETYIQWEYQTRSARGRISLIYSPEGRAISLILVALKLLFGLDGKTEKKLSKYGEKMTAALPKNSGINLFLWNVWEEHVKMVLEYLEIKNMTSLNLNPKTPLDLDLFSSFSEEILQKRHTKENCSRKNKRKLSSYKVHGVIKNILHKLTVPMRNTPLCPSTSFPLSKTLLHYVTHTLRNASSSSQVSSLSKLFYRFSSSTLLYLTNTARFQDIVSSKITTCTTRTASSESTEFQQASDRVCVTTETIPNSFYRTLGKDSLRTYKKSNGRTSLGEVLLDHDEFACSQSSVHDPYDFHYDFEQENILNGENVLNNMKTDLPLIANETLLASIDNWSKKISRIKPHKSYWIKHFHKVGKQDAEKLPSVFCWLLNLCGFVTEMSNSEVYKQVIIVEKLLGLHNRTSDKMSKIRNLS